VLVARRAKLLAEREIEEARDAALAAGVGAVEETDHPGRYGVSELASHLEPLVLRKLELEEQLEEVEAQAKLATKAMSARREATANDGGRLAALGAPGPISGDMFAVLVLAERQRRSGKRDEHAIAAAAGWRSAWSGAGEVPPGLVGKYDDLVRAAI